MPTRARAHALDRGISKMARSYNETTLDQLKTVLGDKLTQQGGTNLTELTKPWMASTASPMNDAPA